MKFLVWFALTIFLSAPLLAADRFIILQSTTSTRNSGLLEAILPSFQRQSGIEVRVVGVGTGQAIKNAENGDGDVLMVHDTQAEQDFVDRGWGVRRHDLMYNDFVIVGPGADPAEIAGTQDVVAAFKKIANTKQIFLSRGDDSGTHKAEMRIWNLAGLEVEKVSGTWYLEAGSGMGATLNIGVGLGGYILTDRATWKVFGAKSDHRILVEGDARLFNQYGVILVSPVRHPHTRSVDGQAFIDWLTGPGGQQEIAAFNLDGEQLFFPNYTEAQVSN